MELIDIVDENNNLTGQVEDRWVAYEKGLWRRTVSCWIMNEKGEILLQKRTADKVRNPNKWAKTGGQVDSGESVEHAIYREVKEELGIEIPKEQINIVNIHKSSDKNKRFAYNFLFIVNYQIDEYKLQKEEVAEVKYVKIEEMELAKKNNDLNYTFCKWDDEKFYKEMELLKNKRKEII
jgi:mutator protein MutT